MALESTLRVMRDPLAGEPLHQSSYDGHDVEDGYDTRYLQPDWNNFGQNAKNPVDSQTSQQTAQTGESQENNNNFNNVFAPQGLQPIQPNSPPQLPYDANFRPSYYQPYPFQPQRIPYNTQDSSAEAQPESPYIYSAPQQANEPLSKVLNTEKAIDGSTENSSSIILPAESQSKQADFRAGEEKVIHPNLQYPNEGNPSLSQKYNSFNHQRYQPGNSFPNFVEQPNPSNKSPWAEAGPLQRPNQYDQVLPNQFFTQGHPQFYQPNPYYFNPAASHQVIAANPDQYG